jgi:hypothetical protein
MAKIVEVMASLLRDIVAKASRSYDAKRGCGGGWRVIF